MAFADCTPVKAFFILTFLLGKDFKLIFLSLFYEVNMSDDLLNFFMKVLAIVIYLALGAFVSWIFFNIKRRDLFGGYIGGLVVGVIGALIGGFILDKLFLDITIKVLNFLVYDTGVNIIAGLIGGYIAVYIMNRLGHNKERKKY
jgi:uncharacterized membrane protein YeaQ/YmgE (transglycosylase-associated protein family)